MFSLGGILNSLLQLFLFALLGRLILDYVRMFSRSWKPRGIVLFIAEFIYGVTDPVMKIARRFIPPLRLGSVAIDLSFIIVFFAVQILAQLTHLIP
jgi:YggT family protein